ncbi:angiomotin-like isoform X3 [Hyposmocoma kahamanoa]|uniref:angiomotin-like isoform X3 n=1 Tax=Hyposmocoma kahamanoa TaxID=1477025 RepID=UPI000E6D5B0C|nr:angiomotin-like isoform X3 [Hyposmocoma kahamanoa]
MGSMRPTGRFLPFANNIQRTQKPAVPKGFPQSLSGSETDVSTSNENLSREERYVVRHTARVEPQGQENLCQSSNNNNRNSLKESVPGSNRNSLKDSVSGGNSNRSSLDVSSSSYNTLIIHNQDDSWPPRPTPIREHERTSSEVKHPTTQSSPYHTLKKECKKPSGIPLPKMLKEQTVTTTANYIDIGGQRIYTSPPDHGVQEITEIPDDFLNQSSVLRKELQGREMLIAQLITQNKELACAKERQEIEMAAQRATLQEQRTHIDILDTALTNAQTNVVRLEEECRHASGYVERVMGLQRALASLQQASDRREHTERKLRAQLEKELQTLRKRECNCGGANSSSGTADGEAELRRQLRERDERLLALEGECAKWEQRYLEEAALRQAAVSAASIPKDAKIAALEKTSAESERLMAEARNEKIRHMDELHSAQKKVADLESRVKELESKVAERDAMIKVLQKHTSAAYDSGASLRNNSSREELVGLSSGASFSSAEGVGGVGAGSVTRYRHLARRNYSPHNDNSSGCGFDSTSLRLDEQLAALESRLERPPVPAVSYLPAHAPPSEPRDRSHALYY